MSNYWIAHRVNRNAWRAGPYAMTLDRVHDPDRFQPIIRHNTSHEVIAAGSWTDSELDATAKGVALLQRKAFHEKRRIEDGKREYERETETVNAQGAIRSLVDAMSPVPPPIPRGFR